MMSEMHSGGFVQMPLSENIWVFLFSKKGIIRGRENRTGMW